MPDLEPGFARAGALQRDNGCIVVVLDDPGKPIDSRNTCPGNLPLDDVMPERVNFTGSTFVRPSASDSLARRKADAEVYLRAIAY